MILVEAVAPFDMQPIHHSTQLYPVERVVELLEVELLHPDVVQSSSHQELALYWYQPYQIPTARNEGVDHDDSKRISEVLSLLAPVVIDVLGCAYQEFYII